MHGDELLGVLLKALPLAVDVGFCSTWAWASSVSFWAWACASERMPSASCRAASAVSRCWAWAASVSLPAWACASERMSSASRWAFSRMSWRWPWISPSSAWAWAAFSWASSRASRMAVRYWSAAACAASKTPFRAREASAREPAFSIFSDRSASFARSWSFSSRRADSLRCSS